ncbi:DUF1905 domain-containing protein [Flaviaesturariibacter flavus]|uniref:DUF1905 domain-containing protein n=1 Tax=Flaviaesturariibacter flavus TaxID=2502780 RepID=A0A4R1B3K5_9BACT|nr:YdeI/OmpD-associated family protein [Flaviaesturariibacter flavus]TCJ12431.1 DUF1905 domain-containing protein [Flaviaesturariibacter flavus]
MIRFTAELKRFDSQGEKTGWTYFDIPGALAETLKPGCRTAYRVKGRIDKLDIKGVSLVPMGGGDFILAVNAAMRKSLRKEKGATVSVQLSVDNEVFQTPADITECLADEPAAEAYYNGLPPSHRRYWVNWVAEAKTAPTRAKRLAMMVDSLARGWGFSEMQRAAKAKKEKDGF